MKLDIDRTIKNLENHCIRIMNGKVLLGAHIPCAEDAIKVMKMWKVLKKSTCVNILGADCIKDLTNKIEEEFFPSVIKQTVTIEIRGENEQRLRNIISTIECVDGVKDVRPHDSRY